MTRPRPSNWYAIRRWQAGYKRVRRLISVPCPSCLGTGRDGRCQQCNGSGNIEVWINEVVHEDE
jgi:DnaJ-class molecular chaperone with C-terminal Zn finger domain